MPFTAGSAPVRPRKVTDQPPPVRSHRPLSLSTVGGSTVEIRSRIPTLR